MTAIATSLESAVLEALGTVLDPELDEPITDLGFVRSVAIDDDGVVVHLRLPTAFCSPNFAYLMVSDAHDALSTVPGIGVATVLLDDHHDSAKINAGIAAGAGYRGTFGVEADDSLDELRATFRRKAHLAAMERCCMAMLRRGTWTIEELPQLELLDLPEDAHKRALFRRRYDVGLPNDRHAPVLVDDTGSRLQPEQVSMRLRFATATRISIEGNSHFCRGLLATRYPDERAGERSMNVTNTRSMR